MDHRLIEGLMEAIAPLIKSYVDDRIAKEVTPLHAQIKELKDNDAIVKMVESEVQNQITGIVPDRGDIFLMVAQEVEKMERPKDGADGKSVTIEELTPVLQGMVDALPKAVNGQNADPVEVAALIIDDVAKLIPVPQNGKDADPVDPAVVANLLVDLMPVPENGKDADPEVIRSMVIEEVAKIERPRDGVDGKSITVEDVRPVLEELVSALPPAQNGKDADPAEVAALIKEDVAKMIPPPEDGKSVSVEDVLPFLEEMVDKRFAAVPLPVNGKDGKDGRDGKDGIGMAGAVLGRDGNLVMTFSDGTTKDLGVIVGKDGQPGRDGKDGLGFDDLEIVYDGERTFGFKYYRGEQSKEVSFKMPIVLDRGVFRDDKGYEKGDGVSYGGSFWIAQKDAPDGKPQDGSRTWRLSVKRGRNGADGKMIPPPPSGPVKI